MAWWYVDVAGAAVDAAGRPAHAAAIACVEGCAGGCAAQAWVRKVAWWATAYQTGNLPDRTPPFRRAPPRHLVMDASDLASAFSSRWDVTTLNLPTASCRAWFSWRFCSPHGPLPPLMFYSQAPLPARTTPAVLSTTTATNSPLFCHACGRPSAIHMRDASDGQQPAALGDTGVKSISSSSDPKDASSSSASEPTHGRARARLRKSGEQTCGC